MSDICMCTGDCPISEYCYRYMADPDLYCQTFSSLESICIPNNYSEFIPYEKNIQKHHSNCALSFYFVPAGVQNVSVIAFLLAHLKRADNNGKH